jgi:hypothetical protein
MCETNPIWPGPILQPGAMAPNKPNSARPAGQPSPWEGKTCEANPIPGRQTGPMGLEPATGPRAEAMLRDAAPL